ncbi:MAG: hypothetical protein EA394_01710 [Bacteroidia bacterium]|nr:MAG: hypothetical protein EA394_01710 [Bacteroidia bacterium]
MIILADSGSTKTDWVILDGNHTIGNIQSVGLNPYFVSTPVVAQVVSETLSEKVDKKLIEAVYFYGAGCSSPGKQKVINDALQMVFPEKHTVVEHDLLAAARALFGKSPGVACILGTGSNSCLYNGAQVTESLFSLGYMFGDEGSGAHLGKTFIADHLKNRVPPEITAAFKEQYKLSHEDILTNIYKKANPNRFLASFTHFLRIHISHPYVNRLVVSCFDAFFEEQISRYSDYQSVPLGCIGSVAYHFREVFEISAHKMGIKPTKYMSSPMEGLVRYHLGDIGELRGSE